MSSADVIAKIQAPLAGHPAYLVTTDEGHALQIPVGECREIDDAMRGHLRRFFHATVEGTIINIDTMTPCEEPAQ